MTIFLNGWLDKQGERVIEWATRKGWEPNSGRTFGDECALLHSEVSEALEAYRNWEFEDATAGRTNSEELNIKIDKRIGPAKPEGVGSELADVLIRLLHICAARGIDLEKEYERKMRYNETRSYRHGKKFM